MTPIETHLTGHPAHSDKTIELNGQSQDNARYHAFPASNCFYQPFDMLVQRFISSGQQCNLVSTSKLSLLPHSIWSMTFGTYEREKKIRMNCNTVTQYAKKDQENWFNMLPYASRSRENFDVRATFPQWGTLVKNLEQKIHRARMSRPYVLWALDFNIHWCAPRMTHKAMIINCNH